MITSKSERDFAEAKLLQRKKLQSMKKDVIGNAKVETRKAKIVKNLTGESKANSERGTFELGDCLNGTMSKSEGKLEQAMKRIQEGTAKIGTVGFYEKDGLEFCDPMKYLNKEALERHGNDPDNRLDECGFPEDRVDRNFLLNHDFERLQEAVKIVQYKWLYLFGDPGRGKTSLATRIVWELIKDHPTEKATFLSVAKWTDSLRVGKEDYLPLDQLRRIVVVDDFDKFDHKKEFQVRNLLMLIEELKNRHLVIITSNYSRDEMLNLNPSNLDLKVMLDRVAGKSIDFPRLTGGSFRR
ncbi:ATP-binding protein [Candidatus Pacearchaeota archaeon]|nr:ATP-binding protein [Candidatus Pacearchaeota archaeon]